MEFLTYLVGRSKAVLAINVIKIAIIVFVSLFLLGHFLPFYSGADSIIYGMSAISLANGSWEYTNKLLQETGKYEFVPYQWVRTVQNTTAIPYSGVGVYGVSAVSYIIGGYAGLFYIGPIFTILLLIFSERIATNLFGRFVGLVTLVVVATSRIILLHGNVLLTDIMFSVFFLLGCFYLLKFFRDRNYGLIFLCSVFFAVSTFFKLPGLIFLPVEIFLVLGYFALQNLRHTKKELNFKNGAVIIKQTFSKIRNKKFFKITALIMIPWLVFFLFWFSYNSYYYGVLATDFFTQSPHSGKDTLDSVFRFDSQRFTWIKFYLAPLVPGLQEYHRVTTFSTEAHDSLGINWQSPLSLLILITALGISLYRKNKRTEVIVLFTFVIVLLFFYSSNYLISIGGAEHRRMIPALPLSFMLFGFIIYDIWKINLRGTSIKSSKTQYLQTTSEVLLYFFRIIAFGVFLIIIVGFFIILLYYSAPMQVVLEEGLIFKDPFFFATFFPIPKEGLTENSVILGGLGRMAVMYDAIPFHPYWGYASGSTFDERGPITLWEWHPDALPKEHIQTLKKIMEEGYEVYTFKKYKYGLDSFYFEYLKTEHGIILKDYSYTFCKVEFIKNKTETNEIYTKADSICYQ